MIAPARTDVPPLLLKADEAAAALQISPKTLWSLTAPRGSIPAVRLGKSVRYSLPALEAWIRDRQTQTTEAAK